MGAKSTLVEQVKAKQFDDTSLLKLKEGVLSGKIKNFALDENGVMRLDGHLCVPNVEDLLRAIMVEAHSPRYSILPGSTKMYHDLRDVYWWNNMKRDIADYVSRRRDLEFKEGDYVFLKVSPMKGIMRFGRKGKLSPRYIGLYPILERIGLVAYRLALPPELSSVHPVFHVSMLRQYFHDPSHVFDRQEIEVDDTLTYEEVVVTIVDRKVRRLRTKDVSLVKVIWSNHSAEEAMWEPEKAMKIHFKL
ncbi:uncharacterized protein LOC142166856 [Nicotiana tabacum]|uniref:Uncharacterized protein LOC142166856 n=1 Tax=Nicotiana tabacum TaxID=4097 RepID=A0AC58SBZ1_TOBAC